MHFCISKQTHLLDVCGGGELKVIMLGSSHGGYLAHLAAKIAPYLVDGVIDNSSYTASSILHYVGIGREIDFTNPNLNELRPIIGKNLRVYLFTKTFWTINKHFKNFFSPSREQIRYILEENHLKIQSKYPKPCYVSYHSLNDKIALPSEKVELYKIFQDLGFDVRLKMIVNPDEIDGKFIKNLDHGMGMSIKTLIQTELPSMLEKLKQKSKEKWNKTNA